MAVILDAFFGAVVKRIMALVEEEVVMVLGVKDELQRLHQKMKMIKSALRDAERKRVQSDLVVEWVNDLKDVLYDADDIIDLCRCEGDTLLVDRASPSSKPPSASCSFPSFISCFRSVPFRHEIGNRLEELNLRIKLINDGVRDLNLLQDEPNFPQATQVDPQQTSPVPEIDVVGDDIENATRDLVQLMKQEEEDGGRSCRVVAITGMGGIGKTTLAQNIFNHPQIQSHFTKKIWVCISQDYSETNILAEIIKGLGEYVREATTKAELQPLLKDAISGQRFFLVLDDAWRSDVWVRLLRNPLQSGATGSRVLVTTRNRNVASGMGARHIHPVDRLSRESGWKLLCNNLFIDSGDEEMQRLKDVGNEIIDKCNGLPLAIKTIAGVLIRKNRSDTEWQRVLRNEIWSMNKLPEELMRALYLSYEDLSSELKQCFLFCSLFKEDSHFDASEVVNYWIVEGFIDATKDYFIEKAYDHLKELDERSLLQKVGTGAYKMHDVLRSMAQFLSRNESFCGRAEELVAISSTTKLRRLTIIDQEGSEVVPGQSLLRQKNLRALFLRACPRSGISQLVALSSLRILMLRESAVEDVPDAIGDLIHLKLLDLDRTRISSLPQSIAKLTNLQVLNLSGCLSLHTLPKAITELRNLWRLRLWNTPLHFIPAGIGRLARLNILEMFIVGEDLDEQQGQGCRLEELKPLKQLRGQLSVQHLERAICSKVRGEQQWLLRDKQHLKHLELSCDLTNSNGDEERNNKIEEVFTQLAPPKGLETLEIYRYFGRFFPNWMMPLSPLGSSLPHLTVLRIHSCRNIKELPPLGTLPQLRTLDIGEAHGVVRMGRELLGSDAMSSSTVFFPKLEELYIGRMQNLEEWSVFPAGEDFVVFPNLQSLCISYCPKLEHLSSGLKQPPVKTLWVQNCGLREIRNFPCITLAITECGSLESICDLPAVKELEISSWRADGMACPSLKCIENLDGLRTLALRDGKMASLPQWLQGLLRQRQGQLEDDDFSLELRCNRDLLERCLEGCEYWPIIQDIPGVSVCDYWGERYMKYTKKPFSCSTNL